MREPQRIAKLLARAGVASRREIERMIEERRIAIGGTAIETPATLVTSLHGVTVDGRPVAEPAPARLFLYHKPVGVLTAERDPAGRPTIYDRMPEGMPRVIPVGRLDLNTEGLLLLTTDGGLKRQLELPSTGVERTYRARAYGEVSQDQLEALSEGIEIDGVRYGSIDANLERRTGANVWIEMRLREGKNREVRRVLEHLGLTVNRLIRTAYGPFILADLPVGEAGEVRQHDLVAFRGTLRGGRDKVDPIAAAPATPKAPRPRAKPVRAEGAERATPRRTAGTRAGEETGEAPRRAPAARGTDARRADARRTGAGAASTTSDRAERGRGTASGRPVRGRARPDAERDVERINDTRPTGRNGPRSRRDARTADHETRTPRTPSSARGARGAAAASERPRGRSQRNPDIAVDRADDARPAGRGGSRSRGEGSGRHPEGRAPSSAGAGRGRGKTSERGSPSRARDSRDFIDDAGSDRAPMNRRTRGSAGADRGARPGRPPRRETGSEERPIARQPRASTFRADREDRPARADAPRPGRPPRGSRADRGDGDAAAKPGRGRAPSERGGKPERPGRSPRSGPSDRPPPRGGGKGARR